MESEAVRDNNHSLVEAIKKKYEDNHTGDEDSFIQIYVPKKGPGAQAHGEGAVIKLDFFHVICCVFNIELSYISSLCGACIAWP